MATGPAVGAVLATLALGVVVGLLYLQRVRRGRVVKAHLVAALAGTALVAAAFATTPARGEGPPGILPLALLLASLAIGWSAMRYLRSRKAAELALAGHAVLGVAGFLVLLAWVRVP